jgi:hypothetical protein
MINFEFTKTDDRRNKIYSKKALASTFMEPIPKEINNPTNRSFDVVTYFKNRLMDLLNEETPADFLVSVSEGYKSGADWQIYIIVLFKATKPSSIVPDDVAKAVYPDDETINNRIEEARTDTLDALKAHEKYCKDAHNAAHALGWKRKQLVEETKKVTRFQQRLAALVAEFDAEYLAQCADDQVLSSLLEDMYSENATQEDEADKWSPESFALVRAHLAKYLEDHKPNALPSRLPCRGGDLVDWMFDALEKEKDNEVS